MSFIEAKKKYAALGVDVDAAIARVKKIPVSLHCWQGDDVLGLMGGSSLTGGIQTTGNYPGRARNFEELTRDLDLAFSLIPGKKRLNLHAIYAVNASADVDTLTVADFQPWIDYAKKRGIALDFNPTFFSHPLAANGTLTSADENIRKFWVRHGIACRKIAAEMGKAQGSPCLFNVWIPDGLKDVPGSRMSPRRRLVSSLDEIFAEKNDSKYVIDAVESKVFGIGFESYTAGSAEFYQNYAATRGICCLLDNGHYHPTESTADKIPSMLCFHDKVALHVTRHVRWDSDHVVLFDDETKDIAAEIIKNDADERVLVALDYFDASINRILAMVTGDRAFHKALLYAALTPYKTLEDLQDKGDFTSLMYYNEKLKTMPFGEVWEEYLNTQGLKDEYLDEIKKYETEVLSKR